MANLVAFDGLRGKNDLIRAGYLVVEEFAGQICAVLQPRQVCVYRHWVME